MEIPPRKFQILILGLIFVNIFLRIDENPDLTVLQKLMRTSLLFVFVFLIFLGIYAMFGVKQARRI